MTPTKRRFVLLAAASTGLVLQSGCSIAQQVLETIFFAFNIVDVWV